MVRLLESPVLPLVPIEQRVVVQQPGLHHADVERPGWRRCRLPSRILPWLVHAVSYRFPVFSEFSFTYMLEELKNRNFCTDMFAYDLGDEK